jgi:hypothetical protein
MRRKLTPKGQMHSVNTYYTNRNKMDISMAWPGRRPLDRAGFLKAGLSYLGLILPWTVKALNF